MLHREHAQQLLSGLAGSFTASNTLTCRVLGCNGADTLTGRADVDDLADSVVEVGGGGFDRLYASVSLTGANAMEAEVEYGALLGGGGDDRLQALADSSATAGQEDVISDFAAGDRIDRLAIDAITGGANDAFSFIGSAAFTAAGQLRPSPFRSPSRCRSVSPSCPPEGRRPPWHASCSGSGGCIREAQMAFGHRQGELGPGRRAPEKSQLRNDAQANGLARMALIGLAAAAFSIAAPFTLIPAVKAFVGSDETSARADLAATADEGPAAVHSRLGFGSVADATCGHFWAETERLGFRTAMTCYATKNPRRLCDPQEKQAFLALVEDYIRAEDRIAGAAMVTTAAAEGTAKPRATGGSKPKYTKSQVYAALGSLAEKGYISTSDFGWSAPLGLRQALSTVIAPADPCAP